MHNHVMPVKLQSMERSNLCLFKPYRLKQSERRFSQSVFCSGGDNNQGLVLSAAEESAQHFAVNDSIVGRPSRGYIAKVSI